MTGAGRTTAFLTTLFGAAGALHAARPEFFDRIVPPALPGPARNYTYASGAAEIGVAGLLAIPRTRRLGGVAAVALLIAVFPANVQMAHDRRHAGGAKRATALARLPLQVVLVAQAVHVARSGGAGRPGQRPS